MQPQQWAITFTVTLTNLDTQDGSIRLSIASPKYFRLSCDCIVITLSSGFWRQSVYFAKKRQLARVPTPVGKKKNEKRFKKKKNRITMECFCTWHKSRWFFSLLFHLLPILGSTPFKIAHGSYGSNSNTQKYRCTRNNLVTWL